MDQDPEILAELVSERRRILEGPRPDEKPGAVATSAFRAICDQKARTVLDRAREVLLTVHRLGYAGVWPDFDRWNAEIPAYFRTNCAPGPTGDELEEIYEIKRTHPVGVTGQEGKTEIWDLGIWLFWMQPDERWWWYYWDDRIIGANEIEFRLLINDAGPLGAVRWLFRGCGSREIQGLDEN